MEFYSRVQESEYRSQDTVGRWQAVAGMACVIGFVAEVVFLLVVMAKGAATVLF